MINENRDLQGRLEEADDNLRAEKDRSATELAHIIREKDKTIRQLKNQRDTLYEEQVSNQKSGRSRREEWLSPISGHSRYVGNFPTHTETQQEAKKSACNPFEEETEDSFIRGHISKIGSVAEHLEKRSDFRLA